MVLLEITAVLAAVALAVLLTVWSIRIIPQARAANVERFGRFRRTLQPGLSVIVPVLDRVKPLIDLREQVVSFDGQPVITEDNLVVHIDTVLFFQVTDPRAADYEIVNYPIAIEQLTATVLRSVIGSMDLEHTLSSRAQINAQLRGALDEASGKWGIRVTRVEIKAIDPAPSIMDAMEKQYRADRDKRAAILVAEGEKQAAILKSEGQAAAIGTVFKAIHEGHPDPELLAYQYVQALPRVAQGQGNTVWMIPNEVTAALKSLSNAFGDSHVTPDADPVPEVSPAGQRPKLVAGTAVPGNGGRPDGAPSQESRAAADKAPGR